MRGFPRSLTARLAVVLLAVLLVTYGVFFALWRAQLNRVLVPEIAQNIGAAVAESRLPLSTSDDASRARWIAQFNARGRYRLSPDPAAPRTTAELPFFRNLETQLQQGWGNDIHLSGAGAHRGGLTVLFQVSGTEYALAASFAGVNGPSRPFAWLCIALGLAL